MFSTLTRPVLWTPSEPLAVAHSEHPSFDFHNLAPGDYTVYGLSQVEDIEYRIPRICSPFP
jgi:hypothetical protein